MDQKELLRKGENGKSDTFAIALVMHLNDSDNLLEESLKFKSIVIDWYKSRGAFSEKVYLIAVSDPIYHKAINGLFEGLHTMEISLRPVFDAVPFELKLHNLEGSLIQQYEFLPNNKKTNGPFAKLLNRIRNA